MKITDVGEGFAAWTPDAATHTRTGVSAAQRPKFLISDLRLPAASNMLGF
jgi:hypothetical protein